MQIIGCINELSVLSLQRQYQLNEFVVKNNGKIIESSSPESLHCSSVLRTHVDYFVKLKTWFDWIYRCNRTLGRIYFVSARSYCTERAIQVSHTHIHSSGTVFTSLEIRRNEQIYQDVPNRRIQIYRSIGSGHVWSLAWPRYQFYSEWIIALSKRNGTQ